MPKRAPEGCGFGKPYGGADWLTSDGVRVGMWRKGQRVRFFDADCVQHGPEQSNVAPAIAFAMRQGWTDTMMPAGLNEGAQRGAAAGLRERRGAR